ncbi:MAG TPA: M20/M25/M40 family metallo-hydrolase [Gemmatimonadaceae bacterium]|nr:M20/M25/M40 family metallo-hydrolase [Gemmatimonadaceae bacterium]
MIRRSVAVVALLASFGATTLASAQAPVAQQAVVVPTNDDVVARLVDEGMHRSHADADLEYLLDVIGPRLTGSAEMRRANEWTQQKFAEYGADRTALEAWKFGVGWTRGPMTLRMLAPQRREMIGVSWAWSPGTNGPLAGDVVFMDARTEAEFNDRFKGKLAGKWVMMGLPYANENPAAPPVTHADSAHLDSLRRSVFARNPDETHFFAIRTALAAYEHPAGLIRDGGKQFGLLTMSGSPSAISSLPQIVIAQENYDQFIRLSRRGVPVRIEADIKNSFTRDPLEAYNTVAEIRGSEHPDEVVILGAHLDSWDLATGGTDNGAGAIAVLEAMRILEASGVKPKRTIRFVLFSGEEEGLFGSQAYVAEHTKELNKVQAVLVLDNGTGRITGMSLQGREDLRTMWKTMLAPVATLGGSNLVVSSGNKTGTDHLSFLPYGVPAFNYDQLTRGYNWTHHSQIDDYDNTVPGDVAQAATIMAVNAWQLADLDVLLPRGAVTK